MTDNGGVGSEAHLQFILENGVKDGELQEHWRQEAATALECCDKQSETAKQLRKYFDK